ncbi:MAG TPA: hypothetical protein VK638_35475 [Edaphobacter sp.]|nr:hypothetical protein [Edaphobacter sp.]
MYKNVLIALNDSPAVERALHRAIALAEIVFVYTPSKRTAGISNRMSVIPG